MKGLIKRLIFTFACISLHGTHSDPKYENVDEKGSVEIRILINENIEGALLDVPGSYKIYNPDTHKVITSGFFSKRNYLQANVAGLKWGEGFPGTYKMKIVPNSPDTSILINGVQYKGSITVYSVSSKIQLVNEINVQDFLKAYLSSEFSHTHYNKTTYESIAIVARTNFYHSILERNNPFWDIKASDFGYQGHSTSSSNPVLDKAIDATSGLILTFKDLPFATAWTENCAGYTAAFETIFRRKSPGPEGVAAGYAKKERESNRWKCTLSTKELSEILELNDIQTVDLYQDSQSKKVYGIRFSDTHKISELSFFKFQELIGKNRILSNDFTVHIVKDYVLFTGYGKGCGVGLCLFSADEMAKLGDSAPYILSNFYPTTTLVKLNTIPKELITQAAAK